MTRAQILTALNDRLTTHYPPDVVDRIQSMISGTLAELDALPPYPRNTWGTVLCVHRTRGDSSLCSQERVPQCYIR